MNYYRFIIMAVVFFSLTSIASNYIILNFTFICMSDDPTGEVVEGNITTNKYNYTQSEKSELIWAVGIGTTIATFPINHMMIKYGAKWVIVSCITMSAVASLFSPLLASFGIIPFLFARFLQGIAYAADFAAIGAVVVHWVPVDEYAIFICILTAFTPLSSFATNSITGFLCVSSWGWRASFYAHAAFGFMMSLLWLCFFSNGPETNRFVGRREIDNIHRNKDPTELENHKEIPYLKIVKNARIWAVWANAFGEHVTMSLLLTYAPIYFNKVLRYDVATTGVLVSLIGLVQIPFKIVCAIASDKVKFVSEKHKMHFFNFLSVGLCGLLCLLIGFVDHESRWISVALFYGFSTFSSSNSGGFYKCAIYVARQYSHFVISAIQFMKCLALFVCPAIVWLVVRDDETNFFKWRIVYVIAGIYMMISHVIFVIFHSDEAAEFTKDSNQLQMESKKGLQQQQQS